MAPKKQSAAPSADEMMVVNDSPGEECRIAILQDGHLEELYTERTASATNVGNIYKGRVVNVEPAIQAAFIDYGEGANGFLHISDLHPKYFPGEKLTERVGKKIPRRERPPIQHALRRGDEILVQVLKEGIGTKGPTLTSYLSIAGRLLVLMPDMDRTGVSRKVEDEQKRREMREILDSLDLPDGFGFILRTAGFGKTKTELKRDAAYLMRLWKVMDKRIKKVGAPCELYTESDLLIRTIRDILRPSIKAVVVDSLAAYDRISSFLQVVSPRSAPKVIQYHRPAPIFHAFDIERQIELIHSSEVPLPSGGRLVIDQTEALVAIDVNSGKSRSARDSETNAYETNCEAADEICRQLRLRDLGGLIVNDLIDMRSLKHRKLIEDRFAANLKRDRARATALRISDFGILEMTRQRMRPSLRKSHFMSCPHCNGHGEIKVPEHVAADAVRHVGFLLQYPRVQRIEMVCSPRVASVLLSRKRRELVKMEDSTSKRVDVRVSDAIAADRVDYYAYDDRNADIDVSKLPALHMPNLEELEKEQPAEADVETSEQDTMDAHQPEQRRGRGRRGGRGASGPADATAIALEGGFDDFVEEDEAEAALEHPQPTVTGDSHLAVNGVQESSGKKRRRRRRRRKGPAGEAAAQLQTGDVAKPLNTLRIAGDATEEGQTQPVQDQPSAAGDGAVGGAANGELSDAGKRGRRRRNRRRRRGDRQPDNAQLPATAAEPSIAQGDAAPSPATIEHPIRVHELARELSVSSKELIQRCEPDPAVHHLSNALATVNQDEAQAIREMFSGAEVPQPEPQTLASPGTQAQPKPRRRRGGRRKSKGVTTSTGPASAISSTHQHAPIVSHPTSQPTATATIGIAGSEQGQRRRRRRGKRGGKGQAAAAGGVAMNSQSQNHLQQESKAANSSQTSPAQRQSAPSHQSQSAAPAPKKRRALYRAGRGSVSAAARDRSGGDDE